MNADLALLIEPEALQNLNERENLVVLDLCKEATYSQLHIPGAVHLSYSLIVTGNHPVNGLLPETSHLEQVFSAHGIGNQTHHRSSLTWFVLHHLGYPHCKGYPGSWSDWGNRDDTPKAMS